MFVCVCKLEAYSRPLDEWLFVDVFVRVMEGREGR